MMPRYSREKLLGCVLSVAQPPLGARFPFKWYMFCSDGCLCCRSRIPNAPLMSDNLLEAVEHAIVRVRADSLASLQLSVEPVSIANLRIRQFESLTLWS